MTSSPTAPPRRRGAALVALALLACSGPARAPASSDEEAVARGRTLASQTVLSDEVLWELGPAVRDRVVAVSVMADDPRYSAVVDRWPEAVPRLAGTSEALLALKPGYTFVASFTSAEARALLDRHGAPTHVLDGFTGFADYRRHVGDIARLAGAEQAGRALVERFDGELARLSRDVPTPAVGLVSFNEGVIAGRDTSFHDVALAAGFRNIAAEHEITGHRSISDELLVSWDPAVIVIPCGPPSCDASERAFAQRPGFSATRAAREGGVIALPPDNLYSVGRGMIAAVTALRRRHPSLRSPAP